MAGKRETSLPNLAPYIPGPGRKKMTPEQRLEKKCLLKFYAEYLKSGEAIKDFKRAKKKIPLAALQEATERIHGKAKQSVEHTGDMKIEIVREVITKGADDPET